MALVSGSGGARSDKGFISSVLNNKTNTSSAGGAKSLADKGLSTSPMKSVVKSSSGEPNRYSNPNPIASNSTNEGSVFRQTVAQSKPVEPAAPYVPSGGYNGSSGSYTINPNGMSDEWLREYYDQLVGILGNQRDAAMRSWDTWAEQQRKLATDETERLRNRGNRNYLLTNKMLRNVYGDGRSGQGATNTMAAYQNWKSNNEGLGQKLLDMLMNINAQAESGKANAETQMAQNYNNYLLPVVQGLTQAKYNR